MAVGHGVLIVVAGLPGSGKSTLASALAGALRCMVLPVDPIEAGIIAGGIPRSYATGLAAYRVAERLGDAHLALGQDVIVDAVNNVEQSRGMWRGLAARHQTEQGIVEVVCGDPVEHRRRVEARPARYDGLPEPTWADVELRQAESEPWLDPHLVLDSRNPAEALLAEALRYLGRPTSQGGTSPV